MILETRPTDPNVTCISVERVSYDVSPGVEHHGLALTVYHNGNAHNSGVFYPPALRVIERINQTRRDILALYLRATLDKGIAFVCPDDELRKMLEEELVWAKLTPRTRSSVLEEF
ncbi:hypothetical protein AURDEDRAFT_168844 [Auricularia subglabra TFB-10046 SS5]|nr:hypothetical protein AURDEDRAFT_168844 [Auricularia subglabra TFB-10046 SS5]